jgi:hypothetical protein
VVEDGKGGTSLKGGIKSHLTPEKLSSLVLACARRKPERSLGSCLRKGKEDTRSVLPPGDDSDRNGG